jgi:hypothetical protein
MRLVIVPLETRSLQELLGAQLVGLPGATKRGEHVPLPGLQVAPAERFAPRAVEMPREAVDAREHLER